MMGTAPLQLTGEMVLTLAITLGALLLFIWNRLRIDVVGLIVMLALILSGLVTPQQGISGFANEAMITVAAMFVLSAALVRAGALDLLGQRIARLAGNSELRLLVAVLALVIPLSAFINNTPVVVVMIPMVLGLTREMEIAPSRLLMPISFGSQLGGTLTLIGTSTNLLVAGLVLDLGLDRIRLFDITPAALVLAALGVAYLLTVGRRLAPRRKASADLLTTYELRQYLTGLVVQPGSPVAGRTLRDQRFGESHRLQVIAIDRAGGRIDSPRGGTTVLEGDVLLVRGQTPDIARASETGYLRVAGAGVSLGDLHAGSAASGPTGTVLAELIVPPRSPVVGRTLRQLNFRNRYGVPILGIQRHGEAIREQPAEVPLAPGDLLLTRGTAREFQDLHRAGELALLGAVDLPPRRRGKLWIAVTILVLVVLLAAFDVMTILVSSLIGVVAMFLTGCITPDEAYQDIDWMVLVLLGTILPLGIAMQSSGTAELIATLMLALTAPLGLYGALAGLYLLTSLLTEVISNNAAAVVLTPIAVATAASLGVSPLPFVVAVMFAASNSFMTPIGYQTNTFIYGPGGYHFSDFVRVGGPLNLLMVIAATLVLPFFFPFHGR